MRSLNLFKAILFSLITCLIAVTPFYTKAQERKAHKKPATPLFAVVEVVIQDSTMLKDGLFSLTMSQKNINSNLTLQNEIYEHKITAASTRLIVPLSTRINYGRIKYTSKGQAEYKPLDHGNNLFIFERGDSIKITINRENVSFSGKGSEKYTCLSAIYAHDIMEQSARITQLTAQGNHEGVLNAGKEQADSLYSVRSTILNRYKPRMDPKVFDLITLDCYASYLEKLLGILANKIASNGERLDYDHAISKVFQKWFSSSTNQKFDEYTQAMSYRFCDLLYDVAVFRVQFFINTKPGMYNFRYTFKQLYDAVEEKHKGPVRDKLNLIAFYMDLTSKDDAKTYIDNAIQKSGNKDYKNELLRMSKNFSGAAFPFELQNTEGKIIKLKDFTGKLVVLDFWFTGCRACINLADQMKPIIRSYKDANVVFISISIDEDREQWIKSVNSENYSFKDEINLYTNGLGEKHPIIKHYNMQGYPALIVISKDGKLISSTPVFPKINKPETTIAFKELIDKNL